MHYEFFIEIKQSDGTFKVIARSNNIKRLISMMPRLYDGIRLELWSYAWVNTALGYAPIAIYA